MPTTASDTHPFPGMNPYLEQHWCDVHTRLMTYLCDQLQAQLPEGLWARVAVAGAERSDAPGVASRGFA